ncbi:sensor histidine kinase [Embleya scabrispora]|uniref:sensor histidine kinase n=1 Tax=Embleya scabrispora TaxID=159449 RepID=UPI00039AE568|nr:HAMP domain-containing sensor histidine kinase [Embleya scabrispora]MYS79707.1 sensor histidine kinase [Streptomyces sp. SID5474]
MRATLALSSIAVLAIGLALLIWFSMMGVRHYLESGVDDDLTTGRVAIERTGVTHVQLSEPGPTASLRDVLMSAGLHGKIFVLVDEQGIALPVADRAPDALQRALAAVFRDPRGVTTHAEPRGISLAGDDYRAVAVRLGDGHHILLARSVEDVDGVVDRVVHFELLVGAALLVLLGGSIYFVARWRLRPLEDMVETASGIAEGGPDRPDLSARVAPRKRSFSEVEQLRTALNAMLQQVESAFEIRVHAATHLKRFVADASHELRTPLAAIRGYLQLYEKGMLASEDERTRALNRMGVEAERMARLVDELLALARLDQRPQLRPRPIDLVGVVRGAVADLRAQQAARQVYTDVPDTCVVLADEATLSQVVGNLLTNVRAHTPVSADVHVSVSEAVGDDGERRAVLRVRDEGPGMRARDAERIFDRFFRAARERGGNGTTGGANSGSGSDTGSGLGMAIVWAGVAANRGSVRVETEPGAGLTVVVELPAAAAEPRRPGSAPEEDDASGPQPSLLVSPTAENR